ncbi:hypothetical protein R3X27_11070 [Tropicimonas sp. TH_r6]|uniref:hypothetical protein n=1 Tax=Tropicimonas sp. TH_r6 TaxID=3082085 RepID=UPI002954CDB9|nr:hypothetical protein [Tropicimonas sp. TH_r6]MDV7143222.1 hypothetical protein [Tropicimonas sp. TH_r6]
MSENQKVATAATKKNELRLDRLSLIGTFGTETKRHALLRHSSGRISKVEMGKRIAGQQVVAIADGAVFLKTSTGTRRLEMPEG